MTAWRAVRLPVLGGLSLLALVSFGDPALQPRDYSKGFAAFETYGIPDVAGATYVKIDWCPFVPIASPLPYDFDASGNAWMLAETRDTNGQPVKGTFVINGGDVIDLEWRGDADGRTRRTDPLAAPSSTPPVLSARWSKGNAERDVATARRFFKSLKGERFPEIRLDADTRGRLFFLAYCLHRRGDATNSAALVGELFAHVNPPQKVLIDAVNLVADAQYAGLYRRFRIDRDWGAYRDGLKALLARYPRGWQNAGGVALLLERVEARLAQPAPVPSVTNGMQKADLELAGRLMGLLAIREEAERYGDPTVLWLIPASWSDRSEVAGDVELEVRARGVKGIPFLLALAADGALTGADRRTVCGDDSMAPAVMGIGDDAPSNASLAAFNAIDRPATRGELARRWVKDMVPASFTGGQWSRLSGDEWVAAIQSFHDQHANDSPEELAILCLPGRYSGFNEMAGDFLLETARRKPVPALERYLLGERRAGPDEEDEADEDDVVRAKIGLLVQYAAVRGAEARPTVARFAAQLKTAADEYTKPANYGFESPEQEKEFVERNKAELRKEAEGLLKLPLDKSIEELVGLMGDGGGAEGGYVYDVLMAKLDVMPRSDALGMLLKQAVAADRPEVRVTIAGLARRFAGQHIAERLKPTDHAEAWQALIADDRAGATNGEHVVSEAFLVLNEALFAETKDGDEDVDSYRWYEVSGDRSAASRLAMAHGRRGRDLLRARVRGRLAGVPEQDLPRYPADAPLAAPARVALKDRLAAVDGPDAAAKVTGDLSIYERAALPELLRHEPALNEKLAAIANTITRVTTEGVAEAVQAQLATWRGRVFSADLLRELHDTCAAQARAGAPLTCLMVRSGDFGGCRVSVNPRVASDERGSPEDEAPATHRVTGYTGLVCGPGLYGAAVWRTAPPPPEESWGDVETSSPDVVRSFERAAAALCSVAMPASEEAFAAFQTKGDRR